MSIDSALLRFASCSALALALPPVAAQCVLQWSPGNANGAVLAFATLPNGDLIAGGSFTSIDGVPADGIARRSGSTWQPLATGIQGTVRTLAVTPAGDLIAGGQFATAGGMVVNHIARWDGLTWTALGAGVSGGSSVLSPVAVRALLVEPNGDLLVGGHFFDAGGVAVNHIARWDGAAWTPLGSGIPAGGYLSPPPVVNALVRLANGHIVAAGNAVFPGTAQQHFALWNGATWSPMGVFPGAWGVSGPARDMLVLPNGDLVACGSLNVGFIVTGPFVGRFTGGAWVPLGSGWGSGVFGIASDAIAMTVLPDGDLLVGGRNLVPTGGGSNPLLRWDGSTWTPATGTVQGDVAALAVLPDGQAAVGGNFTTVGGLASPAIAQLVSPCPATAAPVGTGCAGSAGTNTLSAATLPWLGATLRSVASGMPANSVALVIGSLSPTTIPLSQVLPIGGAGCDGLVSVDYVELAVPSAGQVASELPIPEAPNLVGLSFYQYVATLEFSTAGTASALTASNRLMLTIGAF